MEQFEKLKNDLVQQNDKRLKMQMEVLKVERQAFYKEMGEEMQMETMEQEEEKQGVVNTSFSSKSDHKNVKKGSQIEVIDDLGV